MTRAEQHALVPAPPLRIGLVADADALAPLRAALARPTMHLAAQGGMRQADALPGGPWFDDTRVLIAQGGIDALLIHTAPRVSAELARIAVEHGIHVWRSAPLARRFNEAAELVSAARGGGAVYRVASWWEHVADDIRWAESLVGGFRASLSDLRVAAVGPTIQDWRANANDAGGGVLMNESYFALEALLVARGLPQRVVATVGRCRKKPGAAPRETEDVAAAIYTYEDGGIATIQALWDVPPYHWSLVHHAGEATMEIGLNAIRLRHADGRLIDERPLPAPADLIAREFTLFEHAISASRARPRSAPAASAPADQSGEPAVANPAATTAERQLALTALIETTYLAARTGQPERPAKLYEVQGWPEPVL